MSFEFGNVNRFRIKRLVSLLPGVHLRELQRLLGISFNSTRYHVGVLSRKGEITCQENRNRVRLYPQGADEGEGGSLHAFVRDNTSRRILEALAKLSRSTNKELSELTGLARSTVSEHLHTLLIAQIVKKSHSQQRGRMIFELQDPLGVMQALMSNERIMLKIATDRFVELWDF